MAAERQVGVDPVLERGQPQLLQPRRLGLRERFVAHVLVGRPAPQLERLAKARRRRVGVPAAPAPTGRAPPAARIARDPARRARGTVDTRAPRARSARRPGPGAARARAPGGRSQRWGAAAHPRARRSAGRVTRPRRRRSAGGERSAICLPGREVDRTRSGDDLHGAQYAEVHSCAAWLTRQVRTHESYSHVRLIALDPRGSAPGQSSPGARPLDAGLASQPVSRCWSIHAKSSFSSGGATSSARVTSYRRPPASNA